MSKFMDLLNENDSDAKIREIITAMENDGDVYKQLNYYFNTIYKCLSFHDFFSLLLP